MGSLVLVHGIVTKSTQTKIAAYNLLILSAIGAVAAYLTGEGAEETVEKIPGISESAIEEHGEFAKYAMIALIVTGVTALASLLFTLRKSSITVALANVTLVIALISFGLMARTGYQGGQIRHTELSTSTSNSAQGTETKDDD
jgi:membrane protein YqaA with SNARE-associated domain